LENCVSSARIASTFNGEAAISHSANVHQALQVLLKDLQLAMQACNVWAQESPSLEALSSRQPFCVDTLRFEQWLQFVMMPNFEKMIHQSLPLPTQCDIASMAEEAFKGQPLAEVIELIRAVDELLTKN